MLAAVPVKVSKTHQRIIAGISACIWCMTSFGFGMPLAVAWSDFRTSLAVLTVAMCSYDLERYHPDARIFLSGRIVLIATKSFLLGPTRGVRPRFHAQPRQACLS